MSSRSEKLLGLWMFGEQLVDEHASVSAEKRNLANFAARQVAAKLAKLVPSSDQVGMGDMGEGGRRFEIVMFVRWCMFVGKFNCYQIWRVARQVVEAGASGQGVPE